MTTQENDAAAAAIEAIVKQIKPLLKGKGELVQGGVLADLTAIWLAGHHPALREVVLAAFLETVDQLTPINEKIMFGEAGFPVGGLQ